MRLLARTCAELAEVAHSGPVGVKLLIEVLLAAKDRIHVLISKCYENILGLAYGIMHKIVTNCNGYKVLNHNSEVLNISN